MSNFSVLVITEEKPTLEVLNTILAPWRKYESTGELDPYVQSVDELPEALEAFAERIERCYRSPDGELFDRYSDQFYRDPTPEEQKIIGAPAGTGGWNGMSWTTQDWGDGLGYRTRIHYLPEGWEEVRVKAEEVMTFREFLEGYYGEDAPWLGEGEDPDLEGEHKWGWGRVNDKGEVTELVRRTNPNAKWDWWTVGGRWSGFLVPKAEADPRPPGDRDGVVIIRKGDVDFEAMRSPARQAAGERWDKVRAAAGDLSNYARWDEVNALYAPEDRDKAFEWYRDQPPRKALSEAARKDIDLILIDLDEYVVDREEYVERSANLKTVTFAVVKDGVWMERGKAGPFGSVLDEKDLDGWARDFNKMLDELPDDVWLTVVDCHI